MTELEERLKAGPESVEALLRAAHRPLSLADHEFWHGLAEGAGHRAHRAFKQADVGPALCWARCSVAIYDCLTADVPQPHSFDLSGMFIRAKAIRACGVSKGDPVRDLSIIAAWVRVALVFSIDEAIARSADMMTALAKGETRPVDEARRLRQIKNRLGVLVGLEQLGELAPDLEAWLAVRDRLV